MTTKRIIPCLDVKDGRVVKGVNFLELSIHTFGVYGQYYALVTVFFCRSRNKGRVTEGTRINTDLVRAAFQHPVEVLY